MRLLLAIACLAPAFAQNLIINNLSRNPRSVIYEIPDPEGREDAIRSIESVRNQFWRDAELVDAAQLDEAALRRKFEQRCVLYTTLGERAKLVRAATKELGWEIRDGNFRWRGAAVPLEEVRFIVAAKNPYASGNFVVYAAGSNRSLRDINSVFHGPASFHLYRGTTLVKDGFFADNYVSRETVSEAEAAEDVAQFFSTLERVHPNLTAKLGAPEYERLRKQTLGAITKSQMAVNDLALLLYRAGAAFGDGHTSVHWRVDPFRDDHRTRFPSFALGFDNGRFIITSAQDASIVGMELTAVGGVPIREYLRPIIDACSGETLAFRAARFTGDQAFWLYLTKLVGNAANLELSLHNRRVTVATLDTAAYRAFLDKAAKPRPNQRGTAVEFLADGKVAHLLYESFRYSEGERQKIDDIFKQIRARASSDLIIDLRGNSGGNSMMGDHIFSYLYERSFRQFSAVKIRALPPAEDKTAINTVNERSIPKPEAFFSGRKYLLVDNGTFSSAVGFASLFRDYAIGTILGYETGGVPLSFGDVHSFSLKHSGIPCGVSYKQFFPPKPRKDDDQHGILPDVRMNETVLAEFNNEPDPVLAATLRHISAKTR